MTTLCVHHASADFVVIDKPAGFRSVPARGHEDDPSLADSVESRVRDAFGCHDTPVTVHRLDQDTSGLMVFGLTRRAHRSLSRQFMHRKVGKSYGAVLAGEVVGDEGRLDLPLYVDWPNRPLQCVNHQHGKAAVTLWRVIGRESGPDGARTRVSLRPETGRTHQIRVHAATPRELCGLGCAVVGDPLYAPGGAPGERLLLHAETLGFWEPSTGTWARFHSPAPF